MTDKIKSEFRTLGKWEKAERATATEKRGARLAKQLFRLPDAL